MARQSLRLRPAGAVRRRHGRASPGERTFFLQARAGGRVTSVALEKDQVHGARRAARRAARRGAPPQRPGPEVPASRRTTRGHRPAGAAGRGGVPGRHDGAGLGRRHRAGGHRGDAVGRGRGRAERPTEDAERRVRDAAAGAAHRATARAFVERAQARGRRRPPAVPVLRPAAGPGRATSARAPTATAALACRLSRVATARPVRPERRATGCSTSGELRARGPARRRVQHHPAAPVSLDGGPRRAASTSRCAGSGRCGTSPTAPWPAGRSRRTWCPRRPGGTSCRRRCCATGRSARAWCSCGSTSRRRRPLVDIVPRRRCRRVAAGRRRLGADGGPVTLAHADDPRLRRMAVLDAVVNNADRKGGHVLPPATAGSTASTTGSASTSTTSCAPCCGAGPASRCRAEADAVLAGWRRRSPAQLGRALAELLTAARGAPHGRAASSGCCDRGAASRGRSSDWPAIPWPPF